LTPRRSSFVGRSWDSPEVAVFDAVGITFRGDDFGVVHEAVNHGGGYEVITEHLGLAAE
jgi:hypothetical protein